MKQKYICVPFKTKLIIFLKNHFKCCLLLAYLIAGLLAYIHRTELLAHIPNTKLLFGVTTREVMAVEFAMIAFIFLLLTIYIVIVPVFSNWLCTKRFLKGKVCNKDGDPPRLISKRYNLYVDHEIIYVLDNKNISTYDFAEKYFNDLETAFNAKITVKNYKNSLRKTEVRAIPYKYYKKLEQEPIYHPDSEDF